MIYCLKPNRSLNLRSMLLVLGVTLLAALQFTGCAGSPSVQTESMAGHASAVEAEWGIELQGVRLSAAGHLIDFRYRVLDPDKAEALMHRGDKAYLIDEASGTKLPVPLTKVGQLRGTGTKPKAGRVYAIMFSNGGGLIQKGSRVSVVIGEFRMENMVVEAEMPSQSKLPEDKQAQWEDIRKVLLKERTECIEDCGHDKNCFDKCSKAYKSRLDKEFRNLMYEK